MADDDKTGAEPVAIISNRLWVRAFARRDDAIGAVAAAKPFPIRIIGVAPPDFSGARRGERADVWIPSRLFPRILPGAAQAGGAPPLMAFAGMHPGQTPAGITRDLRERGDPQTTSADFAIVPLTDVFGSPESRTSVIREGAALGVVSGVALLVLVAGCATLAAPVLVHYERRRRELAVRVALGASRARLANGLIAELVVLAGGGLIGAILISVLGLNAMPSLSLPGDQAPRALQLALI